MPGNSLTPLELTGRAMTHVVTLHDPPFTLHASVIEPFFRLRAAAASDGIELVPVSTFRDFSRQLAIWNAKCRGERDLFDRNGVRLDYATLSEAEVVSAILDWSALPGASRHHWGTEIDVVDGTTGEPGRAPQLMPEEYAPGGRQARLGAWLDANLAQFGFHRPYSRDRGGVQPEPWHLSHTETSNAALALFTPQLLQEALDGVDLGNAAIVRARLPEIFERYVMNVDPPPAAGSVRGPDFLEVADHQAANLGHGVRLRGEHLRIAAEHAPALAAQDLLEVFETAIDRLDVRVLPVEQRLDVPVGLVEGLVETLLARLHHELRRLAQQVETGGVLDAAATVRRHRQRDAAEHELRIQPVAALLEITAVGHLRDHVGGAEQVPELDVARVGELQRVERRARSR